MGKGFRRWLAHTLDYPMVERLELIHIQRGDTLAVHVADGWSKEGLEAMRSHLQACLPSGVACIMLVGSTRIEVIRAGSKNGADSLFT
jgi:hypothetical protein